MKKVTELWTRLRVCAMYLSNSKKNMIHTNCSICKSNHLILLESEEEGNVYTSIYQCMFCGATAHNKEVWNRPIPKNEVK